MRNVSEDKFSCDGYDNYVQIYMYKRSRVSNYLLVNFYKFPFINHTKP